MVKRISCPAGRGEGAHISAVAIRFQPLARKKPLKSKSSSLYQAKLEEIDYISTNFSLKKEKMA
jgi:hypothetical protein